MTEKINNLNTDLKDFFVLSEIDKAIEILDQTSDEIVHEITLYNYELIKKYFDSEKYEVLLQHIKFVAYSSFLCEYSVKREIFNDVDNENMSNTFVHIYNLIKQN